MENMGVSTPQAGVIPWQDRQNLGILKAIWQTIIYVLLKPGEFFDNLEIKDSIKEPYLFYFLVTLAAGLVSLVVESLFKQGANSPGLLFGVIATFIIVLIGIFISAAVLHLGVMIVGGSGGFKGTLNVLAYNASTSIFSVIPFVGAIIGGIWGIVIGVMGFKRVHNLSTLRAVIAYFGLFFIVAIIGLLAAIAIPNLLRARSSAQEAQANATVKMLVSAAETYAVANNGQYPADEYTLTGGNYITEKYDKITKSGYIYSLNFNQNGYEISARPETCGVSGTKIYTGATGGSVSEKDCK